ncbi:hypothetical protein [Streptomyces sp. NPDC050560]|uniref:hypothetical protein n=1 Tax=Streptomyces sp. NPDC050560 TaxID=3365630 RepID=UPI0037905583
MAVSDRRRAPDPRGRPHRPHPYPTAPGSLLDPPDPRDPFHEPPAHPRGAEDPRPGRTPQHRALVWRARQLGGLLTAGCLAAVPLIAGGLHAALRGAPAGLLLALAGLATLAAAVPLAPRARLLRRRVLARSADARTSPVAHLPDARAAATLAARLNGLLALLSFGATVYLLVLGADLGAFHDSVAFGALLLAAALPLALSLAAAATLPLLLRGVPAGATAGRRLYAAFTLPGLALLVRGGSTATQALGAATVLGCLAAIAVLGRCARRLRGPAA